MALDGRRDKVIGSWNKMLVAIAKIAPGLANQYAAIGAWDSQLTSQPISPDRPSNLHHPIDTDTDHGAHGEFDHDADGFLTPSFLKTLPQMGLTFTKAMAHTIQDKRRRY